MHRLHRGAGRVEALQHLVAQRDVVVFRQHLPFDAADALRETVGIEAGHGGHADDVAAFAVHHHDAAGFEAQAAGGIVLQGAIDGELYRVALDVLPRFEVAHDAPAGRHFGAARARFAAQGCLELLFEPVLADAVARGDEEGILARLVEFFLVGHADIAEQVAHRRPRRVISRKAALGDHTGQLRQADADSGELVEIDAALHLYRREPRAFLDRGKEVALLHLVEIEQLAQFRHGRRRVLHAFRDNIDAEVGAVGGEGGAVTVEDPAPPRGDQRQVDPVAFRKHRIPLVLRNGDISHATRQQRADPGLDRTDQESAPLQRIAERLAGHPADGITEHQAVLFTRRRRKLSSEPTTNATMG